MMDYVLEEVTTFLSLLFGMAQRLLLLGKARSNDGCTFSTLFAARKAFKSKAFHLEYPIPESLYRPSTSTELRLSKHPGKPPLESCDGRT